MPSFFKQLQQSYSLYEAARREVIKIAGDALSLSKQAIFAFHRDDVRGGMALLKQAEAIFNGLEKKFKREPALRYEGSYRAALEEYVEAKMFGRLSSAQRIDVIKEMKIDTDTYIGGICDLIGELARKVVLLATVRKFKEVEKFSTAAHDIMAELIRMDLTGYLRTKYDQAKQALRRIEEVAYDVSKMK